MHQRPLIWISSASLVLIETEAAYRYPLETGGLLVGYRADGQFVVTDILGPGPGARHSSFAFEPDHEWHRARLVELFGASGHRHRYVGDWHTHPDSTSGALSSTDRRALRKIIRHPEAQSPSPVSAVTFGRPGRWNHEFWTATLAKSWPLNRMLVANLRLTTSD